MKFRARRYINQFLKENRRSKIVSLDISKFNRNQTRIASKKLAKALQQSRKRNQIFRIKAQQIL